ncbi:MAG: class I SAM-dependent methyltransferase [Candidatus Aenigmarchaeota archaeon]|nr:class I SAM-dependent methyltransferase [Candidatus Aenigmarchaeota archaeon]
MASIFSIRFIRDAARGRKRILDAGCGNGVQALYLARLYPEALIHGYDISPEAIERANRYKQSREVPNACFSVSSHDSFEPPDKMDMIYASGSLVGEHEIPGTEEPLLEGEEIVKRRLSRFREMLSHEGILAILWCAADDANNRLRKLAEGCDLAYRDARTGDVVSYKEDSGKIICRYALVFWALNK